MVCPISDGKSNPNPELDNGRDK